MAKQTKKQPKAERKSDSELTDDPRQAVESGEPRLSGFSHGRPIDTGNPEPAKKADSKRP